MPSTKRRRLNLVAICLNIFLPWFLFCTVFALLSFSFHYKHPTFTWVLVGCCALVIVNSAALAYKVRKRDRNPMWHVFATIAFLVAFCAGVLFGDMNFWFNMQPYYDINNLNSYPDVDVSKYEGQSLMDAGRVYFAAGTKLDYAKAMGFKNLDMYCVVPIVMDGAVMNNANYDFWAIGLNCCRGSAPDFRCGQHANPRARSGLRLMRDDQRPFFRLAVQQAEAHYNINAKHPLFFYWLQDPVAETNDYAAEGFKYFLLGVFTHFGFNLLCVVVAVVGFAKIAHIY